MKTSPLQFGRYMPPETYFDSVGDAADVLLDPSLVWAEDDPLLERLVGGLVAGRVAIGKVPRVAGNDRAAVADPAANRLEVAWPSRLSRQGRNRGALAGFRGGRALLRSCRSAPRCRLGRFAIDARRVSEAD